MFGFKLMTKFRMPWTWSRKVILGIGWWFVFLMIGPGLAEQTSKLSSKSSQSPFINCILPARLKAQVIKRIDRSASGFTEGLIFRQGYLYESTGGYGSSGLNRIEPSTGKVQSLGKLPATQFGEGLESNGHELFQLTWKENRLNLWDEQGKLLQSIPYPLEGWGLARSTGPHQFWVSSDGSNSLAIFEQDPDWKSDQPWTPNSRLSVWNGIRPEPQLNELEFVKGTLFANIFHENRIVQIDLNSGCVIGEIDMTPLSAQSGVDLAQNQESVLNGIAYRPETDTFFITGKNWPAIYEVRIELGND
jgi:glutamine cyclotransferase